VHLWGDLSKGARSLGLFDQSDQIPTLMGGNPGHRKEIFLRAQRKREKYILFKVRESYAASRKCRPGRVAKERLSSAMGMGWFSLLPFWKKHLSKSTGNEWHAFAWNATAEKAGGEPRKRRSQAHERKSYPDSKLKLQLFGGRCEKIGWEKAQSTSTVNFCRKRSARLEQPIGFV